MNFKISGLMALAFLVSSMAMGDPEQAWLDSSTKLSQSTIEKLQKSELWVGGQVGLYDNGEVSQKSYGETEPHSFVSPNLDHYYEIGSISKSFTGILLALATLEIENLNLDDHLDKFFPEIGNPFIKGLMLISKVHVHRALLC
jgi:CubicO group peptidase (beta-lactamase class C family)